MVKIKGAEEIREMVKKLPLEQRRIFSITAHIDHGKSTMCDYLLARAGLMSRELAGEKRMTDFDEEEQRRVITIFTTVVNLLYKFDGKDYLIQLNDTPGHISFTGEVSRAIRASDGIVLLVDAVEGVMTQTITNLRLSLNEGCKPVLYINKADRLISELRLSPQEVITRIDSIIREVNKLIEAYAPPQFKNDWKVSFTKNSVAIGSAKDGWGFTYDILKKKFGDPKEGYLEIFQRYAKGDIEWLRENIPLDEAILEMVIKNLPSPKEAQRHKIESIWRGRKDIDAYESMVNLDPKGPLIGMVTKIFIHPKTFQPVLIGRIWSGTITRDTTLYLLSKGSTARLHRVGVMELAEVLDVDEIPAGNMFALTGFVVPAGESFVDINSYEKYKDLIENGEFGFEPIPYASEPVVSRAIKPVDPNELDTLARVAELWVSADPTARFYLDREANQYILSGIDPLQLEILIKRINMKVPVEVDEPIIVYRERVKKRGIEVTTKSPNALNRITLYVEPLEDSVADALRRGMIKEDQDPKTRARILREKFNWDTHLARNIIAIEETNVLINATVGVQRFDRIEDYVIATFRDFCRGGPLAKEPVQNLKVVITDAVVHEDPVHTQMGQIFPMTYAALAVSFLTGDPALYEPVLRVDIKTPQQYMGPLITLLSQRRGRVLESTIEGNDAHIIAHVPVPETLDLAERIRSITSGRAFFGYQFETWWKIPEASQADLIRQIRRRKKLDENPPTVETFARFIYQRT
ncbi:MAG: GTP-binding protein [Crenarchaeota archaeon]|nr:GTP-binding protein [Thermoproteota archaeon]MCR8455037.1 GTP-binding protein [Thermoproteota archaeon]MCR8473363.1 GTP-binding protein [Thermoproteota archaeon]MCR8500893.1 GTP-binding protein [Thermoproteota archaeon]